MDIHSKNNYPGEDIIHNDSHFTMRINPQPKPTTYVTQAWFSFYIFMCPLFKFSNIPLTSSGSHEAPFGILAYGKRIFPAYFIHKGRIHYGFQIMTTKHETLDLQLKLSLRPLLSIGKYHRYELVQMLLFNNKGTLKPLDVKTLVIYHTPTLFRIHNGLDKYRPEIFHPIPYFQSPIHSYGFTENRIRGLQHPELITIGSLEQLLVGEPFDYAHQIFPLPHEFFQFLPQLSFPATKYLRKSYQTESSHWFAEPLPAVLYGELLLSRKGRDQYVATTHSLLTTHKITQTSTETIDSATQTIEDYAEINKNQFQNLEHDAELKALLDELMDTYCPFSPEIHHTVQVASKNTFLNFIVKLTRWLYLQMLLKVLYHPRFSMFRLDPLVRLVLRWMACSCRLAN